MPHPRECDYHFLPGGRELDKKFCPGGRIRSFKNIFPGVPRGGCTQLELTETLPFAWYNRGENQALVGAITFCGEYPGPRFEDKFRSSNQVNGISIADGGKMADS